MDKTAYLSVGQLAEGLEQGDRCLLPALEAALEELSKATGVRVDIHLHASFLRSHPCASTEWKAMQDVVEDAVKTAVRGKHSGIVFPVERAADGTLALIADQETIVKIRKPDQIAQAFFENFGSRRLGICVTCSCASPLAFQVHVGPFFELMRDLKDAAVRSERSESTSPRQFKKRKRGGE